MKWRSLLFASILGSSGLVTGAAALADVVQLLPKELLSPVSEKMTPPDKYKKPPP